MYYFIDRLYKSKLNFIGPRGMTQEGPLPSRVHVSIHFTVFTRKYARHFKKLFYHWILN
jgi:hypothetical protein